LHWATTVVEDDSGGMRRSHVRRVPVVPCSAFKGFRLPPAVIVLAVRWYLRLTLSDRDVEELLAVHRIEVDHVIVFRWVQRVAPLLVDAALLCTLHNTDRYANSRIEADHGRLKARLQPMRGLKCGHTAGVFMHGHAFSRTCVVGTTNSGFDARAHGRRGSVHLTRPGHLNATPTAARSRAAGSDSTHQRRVDRVPANGGRPRRPPADTIDRSAPGEASSPPFGCYESHRASAAAHQRACAANPAPRGLLRGAHTRLQQPHEKIGASVGRPQRESRGG
jgi:DDE domain